MHISCPRCDTVINAKDYNLFNVWECKKCQWRFRGVHANQPHFRNLLNSFIAPVYTNSLVADLANCPHCGSLVDLNWIGVHTKSPRNFGHLRHIGYNGPYVCKRCTRNLPWDYPSQYSWVAEEWNKEVLRSHPKSSVKDAEDDNKDNKENKFAEMAEALYKNKHNIK